MQRSEAAARQTSWPAPPSAAEVRAQLEHLLSSPALDASDRRRAFLRFVVEETLAGRADRLKGFTIALAVFGRDESFDSQADPVVRLEARRLRRDLDSYYVAAGSQHPLRIVIPKGTYVPRFEWQGAPAPALETTQQAAGAPEPAVPVEAPSPVPATGAAAERRQPPLLVLGALAVLLAAALALWVLLDRPEEPDPAVTAAGPHGPSVVVLPFDALGDSSDSRYMAEGLGQELVANLMRFPGFRLYTLPIRFAPEASAQPADVGRELGLGYVVSGQVRVDAQGARVATQLYEADSGRVVWTATYDRPLDPRALIAVQAELAGEIAAALGPAYGVVNRDLVEREAAQDVANLQSYICVLRAYSYRRNFSQAAFGPVLACLEEAVQRDPGYSDAWAMLGWLHLDAGRFEFTGREHLEEEYAKAVDAASHAVELDPDNTLALKALASVYHYIGRYDDSERYARLAAELNPYDPDTLSQLGWRLAVRGKFEEGIPILKRAIERTVNPPPWYFHLVAIDLYLKGDYPQMLEVSQRSIADGLGFGHMLVAIAAGALGDAELARQALLDMAKVERIARDPAAFLRRHGATDEIVAALMAGLAEAQRMAAQP